MKRLLLALSLMLALALAGSLVTAQDTDSTPIKLGETITSSLDAVSLARIFTFTGTAGATITVTAASKTDQLTLGLVLSNATGRILAQTADATANAPTLASLTLPSDGLYLITVTRGGSVGGDFTLNVDGKSAEAPAEVAINSMSVALAWATNDDFNLELRDPVGNAINATTPTSDQGARLIGNANANCAIARTNASEAVNYGAGTVSGGSYEVIVYFNQACTQSSEAREVTITVTVNGTAQAPITARLRQGQQYVASFVLAAADNVKVITGGDPIEAALNLIAYRDQILAPNPLQGTSATGALTTAKPTDTWSFNGTAGQVVTINMEAASGSLDTFLILIGPDGLVVASNDDANADTRNSQIVSKTLSAAGRYVILATRFGLAFGGTEGRYTLSLNESGAVAAVPTTAPGAPTLVPASSNATTVDANNDGLTDGAIEVLLTWTTRADMRLLVRDPQGRVVYSDRPAPADGGILETQGNFNCADTTNTPRTYAYWPDSRVTPGTYEVQAWVNNDCTDNVQPLFDLSVKVRGASVIDLKGRSPDFGLRKSHFVTTFTLDTNGKATAGAGGTFFSDFISDIADISAQLPSATPLLYGAPITGDIDMATPNVVYTFEANAGDEIRVSMRTLRGNLDTFLYLLDANSTQLLINDDVLPPNNTNSEIRTFKIPTSGTYIVVASRYGAKYGGTIGSFELSLTLLKR